MKFKIIILSLLLFTAGVYAQENVSDKELLKQQEIAQKEEKRLAEEAEKQLKKQMKILEKQEKAAKKEQEKQKIADDKRTRKEAAEKEILDRKQKKAQEKESALKLKEQKKIHKKQEKADAKRERSERKLKKEIEMLKAPIAQSSLVIDYDLKFRGASYSNFDYTSNEIKVNDIFQQYLSLNIIGKFDDRVEMSAKFAASGIGGKVNPVFIMPYTEYDSDYSIFLQEAFLTFKSEQKTDMPYLFTLGKQEITTGDGLIFDGNSNGILAVRGRADLTDLFAADAFIAKVQNENFNIYGGSLKVKINPVVEIGVYQERNDTKSLYKKGIKSEDPLDCIHYDNKTFYDLRVLGGNEKYKYKIEVARQNGELVKSSTDTVDYNTMAFLLEGSWSGNLFKMPSNAKLLFSFANANKENVFNPTFTRRYNGLQRIGYGMLFAANNVDSFLVFPEGYAGINTLGFNFNTSPWKFLETGLGLYFYSASDAPVEVNSKGISELYGAEAELGNEIDFYVKYTYKHYFDTGLGFAIYTPPSGAGDLFKNTDMSYLIQLEVNSKF